MNFNAIQKMTPVDLLKDQQFREHYITLYNTCHKSKDGAVHFDRESGFLKKIMMDNKKIMGANAVYVMTAMLDLAYHGLSIEPVTKPLAYILPRSHNLGTKEQPKYEQRVLLGISPYGELALRMRSGIIRYADNPVIVYDGDFYEKKNGIVDHHARHESDEVVAAYIKITRHDGSVEYKDFSMADLQAMRAKSDSKNSTAWTGGPNNQPMRGMIEAKVIKHAFNTYPRLNLGKSTVLETDEIEADAAYAATMAKIFAEDSKSTDQKPTDQPIQQQSTEEDDPLGGSGDQQPEQSAPPVATEKKAEKPKTEKPKAAATPPVKTATNEKSSEGILPDPDDIPNYDF